MQLRALLESLPQKKWVFTNCSEKHCCIALELLGLQVGAHGTHSIKSRIKLGAPYCARSMATKKIVGIHNCSQKHCCIALELLGLQVGAHGMHSIKPN